MLSGRPPFLALRIHEDSAAMIMNRIKVGEFRMDDDLWRSVSGLGKSIVQGLLTVDPKRRLKLEDLIITVPSSTTTPSAACSHPRRGPPSAGSTDSWSRPSTPSTRLPARAASHNSPLPLRTSPWRRWLSRRRRHQLFHPSRHHAGTSSRPPSHRQRPPLAVAAVVAVDAHLPSVFHFWRSIRLSLPLIHLYSNQITTLVINFHSSVKLFKAFQPTFYLVRSSVVAVATIRSSALSTVRWLDCESERWPRGQIRIRRRERPTSPSSMSRSRVSRWRHRWCYLSTWPLTPTRTTRTRRRKSKLNWIHCQRPQRLCRPHQRRRQTVQVTILSRSHDFLITVQLFPSIMRTTITSITTSSSCWALPQSYLVRR